MGNNNRRSSYTSIIKDGFDSLSSSIWQNAGPEKLLTQLMARDLPE